MYVRPLRSHVARAATYVKLHAYDNNSRSSKFWIRFNLYLHGGMAVCAIGIGGLPELARLYGRQFEKLRYIFDCENREPLPLPNMFRET